MSLTMFELSTPVLTRSLQALSDVLRKGQAYVAAKKLDEAVLVQARLYPDMLSLAGQVQRASDSAKGVLARLSGGDNPSFPDTEGTFAELQERVEKTIAFIRTVPAEALEGSETRVIEIKAGQTLTFDGKSYLVGFALPNFFFHVTTAYTILRHNGVEVGKRDYLGQVPLAKPPV